MSKASKKCRRCKGRHECVCQTVDASQCTMPPPTQPAGANDSSGGCPTTGYPGGGPYRIYDPPMPVIAPISGGIFPGKMIFISGVLNPNAARFTINFMCGPYDGSDIALHCDVRLRFGSDVNVFVRNSLLGGGWGGEERPCPYFPFVPNGSFDMIILAEKDKFKIAVNNQHLVEYGHRLQPLKKIDTMKIMGDVRINQIRFQ
uniref:Galectin-8 n=1 Tax=Magallana gigas TaxID=29159 RepID=K1R419_MAGGI|eukprot:XP_019920599.1 PREDICTED: galectin-5 isoform X1 [Crassostrea gigas]